MSLSRARHGAHASLLREQIKTEKWAAFVPPPATHAPDGLEKSLFRPWQDHLISPAVRLPREVHYRLIRPRFPVPGCIDIHFQAFLLHRVRDAQRKKQIPNCIFTNGNYSALAAFANGGFFHEKIR